MSLVTLGPHNGETAGFREFGGGLTSSSYGN